MPSYTSNAGFVTEYFTRDGLWNRSRVSTIPVICLRTLAESTLQNSREFASDYRIRNLDTEETVITFRQGRTHTDLSTIPFRNQEPETMPNIEIDPTTRTPEMMARIAITRDKATNRLLLTIDAKPLHDMLDAIGCLVDDSGNYRDRPPAQTSTCTQSTISTEALLKRSYPTVISLSGVFSQPPTVHQLRELCSSAHAQIRTILLHYQPIDISVTINKRVIG